MEAELSFEICQGYLHVAGRGPSDLDTVRQALRDIKARAEQCSLTRILIDARGVQRPQRGLDVYFVGQFFAELFGPRYRIAVLYTEPSLNKFAENTAVNRGAMLLVTPSETGAERWLLEEE